MKSSVSGKLNPVLLSVCILFGHFSGAAAQDCLDYSTYLRWVGDVGTPGTALTAAAQGDHLFVADGQAGLQVFSIVDPAVPTLVHTVDAAADARDVAIDGEYVFVAAGTSGLHVVNISDPSSAFIENTVATEGPASGVFISENLVYVAVEESGLQIFDFADAPALRLINTIDTPGVAYGVSTNRYFAFVADGLMGIQIIDLLDPSATDPVAVVNTPGNAKNVVLKERNLFVSEGDQGVTVINLTSDHAPEGYWLFSNNGNDQVNRHPVTLAGNARYEEIQEDDSTIWGLFTPDSLSHAEYAPPIAEIFVGRISFEFKLDTLLVSDPSFGNSIDIITSNSPGFNAGDFRVGLDPADGKMVFSQDNPETGVPVDLRTNQETWVEDVWYEVEITWDVLGREMKVSWSDSLGDYSDFQSDGFVSPCFSDDAVETLIGSRSEDSPLVGLTVDWLKVEISQPTGHIETTIHLEGYAQELAFQEDHAFVALEYGDLQVIDFTMPELPVVVGSVDTPNHSHGVALTKDYAYVTDKDAGVQVIGCSAPNSPEPIGVLGTPGSAYGVAVAGNLAFVADREFGFQIVDITSPELPIPVARVETPGNAVDVTVAGNYAYVAEAVFSKFSDKSFSSEFLSSAVFPKGNSTDFAEKAARYSSLQIIDVSNPVMPVVTGTVETPGFALDVEVAGSFSYVADFTGLLVIDTSVPNAPTIAGSLETPGAARDLAISGSHAFVADLDGLQVIDISVPSAPQPVGSLDTPGAAYGVAVSGNTAFVADVVFGLHVIDVTNPASPLLLGTVHTPGGAYDVEVIGNFAYVSDGFDTDFSSLQIVDVSVPGSPYLVGNIDIPRSVYSVALEGEHAFVTDGVNGLQILGRQCDPGFLMSPGLSVEGTDIHFQSSEGPVEIIEGLNLTIGIAVKNEGDRSSSGRVVFEFEDDSRSRQTIGSAMVHAARKGASGNESYVEIPWVVQDANTVIHVSLQDVQPPDGNPSDNHAQAALSENSLVDEEVISETPPIVTRLLGTHPNPFNPQTTISFAVERPQQVEIMVFDIAGRLISVLADQLYEAGYHTVDWKGKNSSGQDVSSGIYFLRMKSETTSEVRKLTLVR